MELSDLNSLVIYGDQESEQSGASVANAGDVNGDGIDDFLIAASAADLSAGRDQAGRVFLLFGRADLGSSSPLELSKLNRSTGLMINGERAFERIGVSVSSAGDLNADGVTDIVIGAPYLGLNETLGTGRVYVLFGRRGLSFDGPVEFPQLEGTQGFVIRDDKIGEYSGISVSGPGDINADGIDDLVIGAVAGTPSADRGGAGRVYVIFGRSDLGARGTFELSSLDGRSGFVFNGGQALDFSGLSVSGAGDVNDDGIADLIIGAPGADPSSTRENAGQAYVVFGGPGLGVSGFFELANLDGRTGFTIRGDLSGDSSGTSVSNIGDVNADGVNDLIIGAPASDVFVARSAAGKAYVVFGGKNLGSNGALELSSLNGKMGFLLHSGEEGDYNGWSTSGAGDINGDGIDDFLIGAFSASVDPGRVEAGKVYVVFGSPSLGASGALDLTRLDGATGFTVYGQESGDNCGTSVSSAGDVNADGIADILIGADLADPSPNREDAGKAYVLFGRKENITATSVPIPAASVYSSPGDALILSLSIVVGFVALALSAITGVVAVLKRRKRVHPPEIENAYSWGNIRGVPQQNAENEYEELQLKPKDGAVISVRPLSQGPYQLGNVPAFREGLRDY